MNKNIICIVVCVLAILLMTVLDSRGQIGITGNAAFVGAAGFAAASGGGGGDDITSGLIGHWKLDEGSGTSAADSSASGNTGTLVGSITWASTPTAVESGDIVTNRITLQNSVTGTTLSLSGWVYFTWSKGGAVLAGTNSSAGSGGYFLGTASELKLGTSSGSEAAVTVAWDYSTWYNVLVTRNGTAVNFYTNGVQCGTTQTLADNATNNLSSLFGYRGGSGGIRGRLRAVRAYNRVLTSGEISTIYSGNQ